MCEFQYDYVNLENKAKLSYMDRQLYSINKKQKTLTQTLQKNVKYDLILRWKNNETICCIESHNKHIFNKPQQYRKKGKDTKKCVMKRNLKLKEFKNCFKATQLENNIKQLEKNKVVADSFRKNHKDFIKNNNLIRKYQQRFRSKKYNVFTKEVKKLH